MRALLGAVVQLRPSRLVVGEAADGNEAIVEATTLQPDVLSLGRRAPGRLVS